MKKKILASVTLLTLVPSIALAQDVSYFTGLITDVQGILNALVPVLIAAAVVYFLWGVLQFVASGDDEEKRKAGRGRMIHGIIAIFVMVSLWGLIGFLGDLTGVDEGTVYIPPEVNR